MSTASSNDLPINAGAGVGAAAWVVGVVVTFIVGQLGISQVLSLIIGFAPLQGSLAAYSGLHTWFISGLGGGGLFAVLMLIPILLLVGAGFYLASQNRSDNGFATGASIAVGYLAMTVLGVVLLMVMGSEMGIVDLIINVAVAGIVFPVLFGGIGGLVADQA